MSWVEKIQNDLIITTGDGREYRPNFINPSKSIEYNISEFDFANVDGTLVLRERPRGTRLNIEIYFQGDDHLDLSDAFELSSQDTRPWIISHPYYGRKTVHPISLVFDNSTHNVTKITGELMETITEDNPKNTIDPTDKITTDKVAVDDTFAESFASDVEPDTQDINTMTENNSTLYNEGKKSISLNDDFEEYFNSFNNANSAILDATAEPLAAIRLLQAVVNKPASFQLSVRSRIDLIQRQFSLLRDSVSEGVDRAQKRIYETLTGGILSGMCLASVTNAEYENRSDVVIVLGQITDSYNLYLSDLDSVQSEDGGSEESYIPDFESQIQLNNLITFTVSNLFEIAVEARQERTIYCEADTNIVLLTHRFYGITEDDSQIDEFIRTNNIGLNELLGIKKGRKITYYV